MSDEVLVQDRRLYKSIEIPVLAQNRRLYELV